MRAGEFEDRGNTCEKGGEEDMDLKVTSRYRDFYCFKVGKYADVKKLRR